MNSFEILTHRKDDDSYMWSDTDYYWSVVSTKTGDELYSYSGSSYSNANGTSETGVSDVTLRGNEVIVTNYDGTVQKDPLPDNIVIMDGGKNIQLHWRDRVEERQRCACVFVTKFGQPYQPRQLVKSPN